MVTASEVVEAFKKDRRALKELSELIVSEPDVRLAIINAILRDVTTKEHLDKKLREHEEKINKRIDDVNKRIDDVAESINKRIDDLSKSINKRIDTLEKFLASSLIAIVVTLATTILLRFIP